MVFSLPRDGSEAVFDIVIGNPPYVRQEESGDQAAAEERVPVRYYTGTADLFVCYERVGR